jgi:hypothetical protein
MSYSDGFSSEVQELVLSCYGIEKFLKMVTEAVTNINGS